MNRIERAVAEYYSRKFEAFGATAQGADWNSTDSQELRFAQLLKLVDPSVPFCLLDFGCGYAALARYLESAGRNFEYHGYDISLTMKEAALALHPNFRFYGPGEPLPSVDYVVSSGIFNVRLDTDREDWGEYILATLSEMNRLSSKGFAFNCLTAYADEPKKRSELYYADPLFLFHHVKQNYSPQVALLHDYGLYEFTILVRK